LDGTSRKANKSVKERQAVGDMTEEAGCRRHDSRDAGCMRHEGREAGCRRHDGIEAGCMRHEGRVPTL